MASARLSEEGFANVMEKLRSDKTFRNQFLSDRPDRVITDRGLLTEDDAASVAAIKWDSPDKPFGAIDEKLVLCSSSGF